MASVNRNQICYLISHYVNYYQILVLGKAHSSLICTLNLTGEDILRIGWDS